MTDKPLRRRSDAEPNDSSLRALIVDDDDNYRLFLSAMVARFGFTSTQALDGAQALEILGSSPAFDLLLIDLEMPRVNGLETITAIRADERFSESFAVMVTAREDVQTKIDALRL